MGNVLNNQRLMYESAVNQFSRAKPFLKWAGGKSQLIEKIDLILLSKLKKKGNFTYVEPFIGSGAVMFYVIKNYFNKLDKVVINDINPVLVATYRFLKEEPSTLIKELTELKVNYFRFSDEMDRSKFFYEKRDLYNLLKANTIEKASLLIFLNKTCFNGLYRVNKSGNFNVPFGRYKNPSIFDEDVLLANSQLLQKVIILEGDFEQTWNHIEDEKDVIYYFDPPYKPLTPSASFNSYASEDFNDNEQFRLKQFCDKLNDTGYHFILSNSDLKNIHQENHFFDDLYKDYTIERVAAKRAINSNGNKRGEIFELIITNKLTE
jgi:DNA adenine methylase